VKTPDPSRIRPFLLALLGFVVAFFAVNAWLPVSDRIDLTEALPPARETPDTDPGAIALPTPEPPGAPPLERMVEKAPPTPVPGAADQPPTGQLPADVVVVHGLVTDTAGVALEGAVVWVTRDDGEQHRVRADDRGRYALTGVALGTRRVTAMKGDHHLAEAILELTADVPLLRHDFRLVPEQVVRVLLVTPDGRAALPVLREAKVELWRLDCVPVATREEPGATFTGVEGSLNNRFGIGTFWQNGGFGRPDHGPECYGTVSLHEDSPAWLSLVAAHQVLRTQRIDPSTQEVTFVVTPKDFDLSGEVGATLVAAEDGAPLAGTAFLSEYAAGMGPSVQVGEDGRVHFEDAKPGECWLVARVPGRAPARRRVSVVRGERLELGSLPMYPPVELSGRVCGEDGSGIQAVLRWGRLDPASGGVSWASGYSLKSEVDGGFRISGLEPGIWVVKSPGLPARPPRPFDDSQSSSPVRVDASLASVDDLRIELHPTVAVTLVCEQLTEPWIRACAYDSAGLPANSAWPGRWLTETPLRLVPGEYELVVTRADRELERRLLVVGRESQRIELSPDTWGEK